MTNKLKRPFFDTYRKLILKNQKPNTEICIVIPVFNEDSSRIITQLKGFINQINFHHDLFELIYVINNKPLANKSYAYQNNQKLLGLLRQNPKYKNDPQFYEFKNYLKKLNVFVIDLSSKGKSSVRNNVGFARNIGVIEACYRFYSNRKNGLIIQTDADSYLTDFNYFYKVINIFKSNPKAVGASGGLKLIYNPDLKDADNKEYDKLVKQVLLSKKMDYYISFLKKKSTSLLDSKNMFGAHMISKSVETFKIGGVKEMSSGEDFDFGHRLYKYSIQNKKVLLNLKTALYFNVSLRPSDRTGSNIKLHFKNKPKFTKNPFAPKFKYYSKYLSKRIYTKYKDPLFITNLFTNNKGRLALSKQAIKELCGFLYSCNTLNLKDPFFDLWKNKYLPKNVEISEFIHSIKYPPLTYEEIVDKAKKKILKKSGGKELIDYIENLTKL